MVREAGASEVHVRISCPPTISPCYYGVDTPTREELIAAVHSVEEIRQFLGADSLGYLSMTGLRRAIGDTDGQFCNACYTGAYPTELVQLEVSHREPAPSSVVPQAT
jgi:amidophosphoribosyltransferase